MRTATLKIMVRNHAARLFFSLAIEQSNEEAIWAWMLSSPHIEIKHRVSCSGHAILSGVLSMRGLVTARQAFTRHMRTEPARAGPARCGGPGQHGSARLGTARHGSARVYTTITNRANPCWPGYKCSCKRGISLGCRVRHSIRSSFAKVESLSYTRNTAKCESSLPIKCGG